MASTTSPKERQDANGVGGPPRPSLSRCYLIPPDRFSFRPRLVYGEYPAEKIPRGRFPAANSPPANFPPHPSREPKLDTASSG